MVPCSIIRNPRHGELCFGYRCLTVKNLEEKIMNKQRRKDLQEQSGKLEEIRSGLSSLAEQLEEVKSTLESIRDEEEMAFDNMPEPLQEGDKGTAMLEAMSAMEDAIDGVDTVASDISGTDDNIQDALDRIQEAINC